MSTVTPLQARETLAAAIARGDRLVILTGDARSGISALCRTVIDEAGITASWIAGHDTLTFHELLRQAASALQAGANPRATADELAEAASEQELLALIGRAIDANPRRAAAVVVDAAHAMRRFVVARMPVLAELSAGGRRLTVLLSGQTALDEIIDRPDNLALRQQITTRLRVASPSEPERPTANESGAGRTPAPGRPRAVHMILVGLAIAVGLWVARTIARRPPTPRPTAAGTAPASQAAVPPSPTAQSSAPAASARQSSGPPSPARASAPQPGAQPPVVATATPVPDAAAPAAGLPRADAGRPSTPELDARLEQLHQRMETEAIALARRGDVNALIALRARTEAAYAQIGARRPDFLAALLGELDSYMNQARGVRRP